LVSNKIKNMKQLLSLFLFLLPCLAWAQYPSNGNQKITLGEQTSADGLIYRGVAADTGIITPSSDTSAYIILDTVNHRFYNYNRTTNVWSVAGGGTAVTSITGGTGLTGGTITTSGTLAADTSFLFTQSDTLALNLTSRFAAKQNTLTLTTTGTSGAATLTGATLNIPQYSGGGGVDSTAIKYVNTYGTQTVNGAKTFTSVVTGTRFDPTANTVTGDGMYLPATNSLGFSTAGTQRIHVNSAGKVGIGTQMTTAGTNDYGKLNVNGFLTFESQFFAYRNSGIESDGYAYFNLRDAGASGAFGTGLTGQFEFYTYSATSDINAFLIGNYQAKPIIFGTNAVEQMRVAGDGEVNIGYGATDNGAYKLQINGQPYATSSLFVPSDLRFKENIQPLDKGLEIINKLKPVKFNFITTTENNFSEFDEIGFIAQDVEGALSTELFAKAVVKKLDEDKEDSALGLMTEKLIPILVKAIQEQTIIIKQLEQRIINLENK
jgi:hypothetical protein